MMRTELIVIESEADYGQARELVDALMLSDRAADIARLRAQALLIADWERRRYPASPPDPIEAIKFRIEQLELKPREVEHIFGARSRTSEVLSGKRGLSLAMIRRAHRELNIPLEVLIGALADEPDAKTRLERVREIPGRHRTRPRIRKRA